jgi:hypothetical protein
VLGDKPLRERGTSPLSAAVCRLFPPTGADDGDEGGMVDRPAVVDVVFHPSRPMRGDAGAREKTMPGSSLSMRT